MNCKSMQIANLGNSFYEDLVCAWEMQVWTLGQEDPLEEERAAHSGILAWKKSHG